SGTRSAPRGAAERRRRASASSKGIIASAVLPLFVAVVAATALGKGSGVGERGGEEGLAAQTHGLEAPREGRHHDAVDKAGGGPAARVPAQRREGPDDAVERNPGARGGPLDRASPGRDGGAGCHYDRVDCAGVADIQHSGAEEHGVFAQDGVRDVRETMATEEI